jgi:predicted P-loop ATPase
MTDTPKPAFELANIPTALRDRRQWLCWRFEQKETDKKPRKMPYYASGAKRFSEQGSPQDRRKLAALDAAVATASRPGWNGIGFAFLPGDGIVGIDIDDAIDPETGEVASVAEEIVHLIGTYTEVTPSGKGLHLYVLWTPPEGDDGSSVTGRANDVGGGVGVEMYSGRQYFTVTGRHWPGTPDQVMPVDAEALERVKRIIERGKKRPSAPRTSSPVNVPTDLQEERKLIESALAVIDADLAYNEWIAVGMAIYAKLGADAFGIWDYWSRRGASYPGESVLVGHWKSFDGRNQGGAGVIFSLAKQAGWRFPTKRKQPGGEASPTVQAAPAQDEVQTDAPPAPEDQTPAGPPPQPPLDDEYLEEAAERASWVAQFRTNKYGLPLPNLFNTLLVLDHDPAYSALAFNSYAYRIVRRKESGKEQEWTDSDDIMAMVHLSREYEFEPRKSTVMDAVMARALACKYNPLADYLNGLKWDGESRIKRAFMTYWGAASPSELGSLEYDEQLRLRIYLQLAACYWFVGAVARALRPGCKLDTMVVLEGGQGAKKSSSLKSLFGEEFFADSKLNLENKDALSQMQGKWGYEMGELDAFSKAEDNLFKLFMSSSTDRVRWHYGKRAEDVPRASIFIGTTNQGLYGKDPTGMRRVWPVQTGIIDYEAITRDRDQLWAEAVHYFREHRRWWVERDAVVIDPERSEKEKAAAGGVVWTEWDLFREQADKRQIIDAWAQPILEYIGANNTLEYYTTAELLGDALKLEKARWSKAEQMRVGAIMQQLGYLNRKRGPKHARFNAWIRPDTQTSGGTNDIPF